MSAIASIVIVPGDARVTEVSEGGVVAVPLRSARRRRRRGRPAAGAAGPPPVPGGGTLVIGRPDVLDRLAETAPAGLPWVVALELSPARVLERAEALSLAATVGVRDYLDWLTGSPRPAAIHGRAELAARIGAEADASPLHASPRYVRMTRADGDLPGLLGDYLAAYADACLADV
ncbi:MAG TPA: hypothetical protein VEX86_07760 [Longimicrobium sp.]|nr:hypothetical protein [Longimicrobium sp.]